MKIARKRLGITYFVIALVAFVSLFLDILFAYVIEQNLYGLKIQEWETTHYVAHWILISILWGLITFLKR